MKITKKDPLHYEFLPSALEIVERPTSRVGSLIIWIIFSFLIFSILWTYYGKIDVVAISRGKVIPDGKIKTIQPLEEGLVTAIHVKEGQKVTAGQLLIELDSSIRKVDVNNIEKEKENLKLENEILQSLLSNNNIQQIVDKSNANKEIKANLVSLYYAKNSEYKVKKDSLILNIEQNESELKIVMSDMQKLQENINSLTVKRNNLKEQYEKQGVEELNFLKLQKQLEILEKEENTQKTLFNKGAITKKEWEDKYNELSLAKKEYQTQKAKASQEKNSLELNLKDIENELNLTQNELTSQSFKIEQAKSKLETAKKELENLAKERNSTILDSIVENNKKIEDLNSQFAKVEKGIQFTSLTSPVNGTVHGLSSNTIGGIVTPAQSVITIVPDNTPLIIEANVLNKDIGFVKMDQEVEIKLDTFPFQKYGIIKGKIINVSPDAFEDEKLGSIYKIKIKPEKTTVKINENEISISPGMTVSAEIKTGKRRIIDFFLEPLIKYTTESVKLR